MTTIAPRRPSDPPGPTRWARCRPDSGRPSRATLAAAISADLAGHQRPDRSGHHGADGPARAVCGHLGSVAARPDRRRFPQDRLQPPSAEYWFGTDQFGRDIAARAVLRHLHLAAGVRGLGGHRRPDRHPARRAGRLPRRLGGSGRRPVRSTSCSRSRRSCWPWRWCPRWAAAGTTPRSPSPSSTPRSSPGCRADRRCRSANSEFIKAGRVLGIPTWRLLWRHVVPNVSAPIVVQITLALSWAILTESALSFLGLGTQPPDAEPRADGRRRAEPGVDRVVDLGVPGGGDRAAGDRAEPARRRPALGARSALGRRRRSARRRLGPVDDPRADRCRDLHTVGRRARREAPRSSAGSASSVEAGETLGVVGRVGVGQVVHRAQPRRAAAGGRAG